jgi:hypothetical protein
LSFSFYDQIYPFTPTNLGDKIGHVAPGGTLVITFLACVVCLAVGGGLGYAFRGAENKALKAALALAKSDLANLKADALKKL